MQRARPGVNHAQVSALSAPQLVGYLALVLGVISFLQRDDKRLKQLSALQGCAYGLHFLLLHNLPASANGFLSLARNFTALRTRSNTALYVFLALVGLAGVLFVRTPQGLLPMAGGLIAAVAVFKLDGIQLRLAFLCCTLLWLANNLLSRSIGGTLLELFVLTANGITILRLLQAQRAAEGGQAPSRAARAA
jgi:Bacterial inner membrane protein